MTPEEIENWVRPPVQRTVIWIGVNSFGAPYEIFTEEAKALRWLENGTNNTVPGFIDRENEWRARRLLWSTFIEPESCAPVHYVPAVESRLEIDTP